MLVRRGGARGTKLVNNNFVNKLAFLVIVKGEGPDRQGSGSANSGCGEISGGNCKTLILVMAKMWRNSVFLEIRGETLRRNVRAFSAHM